ncbi:MAG: glycosyltransferase family 4 protein [Bacteroidales bacterium]|nr:glycosyltransferase family 4 protein [Bacteroidales bacterium]
MVYIVTTESFPRGLAATQRIRCYAESLVRLGQRCEVLCVNRLEDPAHPLGNTAPRGELDGYTYRYLGRSTRLPGNPVSRKLVQAADTLRLAVYLLRSARRSDKLIFYSYSPRLQRLVLRLSALVGFEAYLELNEHPEIHYRGAKPGNLRRFAGILCISRSLKQLLQESGIPAERIHEVPMAVSEARFTGLARQAGPPCVAYCGAADNAKDGVDRLLRAFADVSPQHPEYRLRILGPKRAGCANERLAEELGILDKVEFAGMASSDALPQQLVDARILALARPQSLQAQYGFPTKLGEYLLSGNPVVVTAVGDIPLYLKDGESAYLAEPDSVEAFAAKLAAAMDAPAEAAEIGARGRTVALENFSLARVAERLKEALGL